MSEKLNTFAIISFNKNSFLETKYEYISSKSNESYRETLNEIETYQKPDDSLYKFWIAKNNRNEFERVSAVYLSDDSLADTVFGPFETLNDLNSFVLENNIIMEN